jgi:hypothetical protein
MASIWELDFYSRPVLNESQKKVWELLICESPMTVRRAPESLFRYAQWCSPETVNSLWLKEAIEKAISQAGETPKRIRFFRRQMNNMIVKACTDLDIPAAPSRRTYHLEQWIAERMENFYPQQEGYDEAATQSSSVQYPAMNAIPLPDAVRGDRADKWAFVTLEAEAFAEMNEWDISFSEAFPLESMGAAPQSKIPGMIIFSPRALPLAGWLSGLELGYLTLEKDSFPRMRLETGFSDSWILANLTTEATLAEAEGFEMAKKQANGIHFLAIQSPTASESFAGFWLLKE